MKMMMMRKMKRGADRSHKSYPSHESHKSHPRNDSYPKGDSQWLVTG